MDFTFIWSLMLAFHGIIDAVICIYLRLCHIIHDKTKHCNGCTLIANRCQLSNPCKTDIWVTIITTYLQPTLLSLVYTSRCSIHHVDTILSMLLVIARVSLLYHQPILACTINYNHHVYEIKSSQVLNACKWKHEANWHYLNKCLALKA